MNAEDEVALLRIENANLRKNVEQWKAVSLAQERLILELKGLIEAIRKGPL